MISKRKLLSALLATTVILPLLGASGVAFAQAPANSHAQTNLTITRLVANNTNLSTFMGLLTKANLTKQLNGSGNFTVFAPTNAAFSKMNGTALAALENNSTALKRVLQYHIVKSRVYSLNFTGNGSLSTLAGVKLPYSVNAVTGIRVDNASVIQTNINATNGVIHLIDGVMIPPAKVTTTATASAKGGFLGLPGFEAVYAVAGLVAVAYLALRRRK
jgi:PGF-CTERM protein